MSKSVFEKAAGEKLQSGPACPAPEIERAVKESDVPAPESGKAPGAPPKKHRFAKILAAVAAVAVCAAGILVLSNYMPAIEAHAQTVYDSGGRLSGTGASEPDGSFVNSCNGFGLELLRQTYFKENGKNVFQSPASVYLALGMTYNGAKGETAAEFAKVLGGSGGLDEFDEGCAGLQGLLTGRFRLANSIWLNSPFAKAINGDFLARDKKYFGASVSTLNFQSHGSADLINRWVKDNTNGRIDPKYKNFDSNTAMLLVNTIAFKSDWKEKFDANDTRDGAFHSPAGDKTVKFMHGMRNHYIADDTVQGILLPYDDGRTSLLILLPKKDADDMLGKLTASGLAEYVGESRNSSKKAFLSLPRVNLSCDETLNDPLKAMGLKHAFDNADFSGMAAADVGLYISKVRHMTYLAIDEKGTEAAAATAVEMKSSSAMPQNVMRADRPFYAAIVNDDTGTVLFSGIVNDPSASG